MENKHSLPHTSKNGPHIDNYSYVEGKVKMEKFHELIEGPTAAPRSIEALRQRLKSQKGISTNKGERC